jgi:hypothetical protein
MASQLEGKLAKTVARAFKGKLTDGVLRREVPGTGNDEFGDPNAGIDADVHLQRYQGKLSMPLSGISAGIPQTDVGVLVLLQSVVPRTDAAARRPDLHQEFAMAENSAKSSIRIRLTRPCASSVSPSATRPVEARRSRRAAIHACVLSSEIGTSRSSFHAASSKATSIFLRRVATTNLLWCVTARNMVRNQFGYKWER